ncbi:sulfite exporter TauE/SafE family protein [Chishuiella changwenlii]|uniref:sulfite exporter TauE/SafE family protein n=1 Tax=Chishuiella changwenlii TaxID=1434701 RepID=UPI002FD9D38B
MELDILFYLCIVAFIAGFIDSIVGGGGLIQTPLSLAFLPNISISSVIGTLKIPAFSGTAIATYHYLKKVKVDWQLFLIMAICAFGSAFIGSQLLTVVSNEFMKPLLLIILIALAIYTIFKKDFGQAPERNIPYNRVVIYGCAVSIIVGFYDGFIGPGTGTFFILGFVTLLGMDFLKASTNAKLINLATNFGSICLFLIKGQIIWKIALPMAVCNALGGFVGAKLAISKGNQFIRYIFIFVILLSICRFGYEVIIN